MSAPSRRPETRRRQARKDKIRKLRRRYAQANSDTDRQKIFAKVKVMSPQMKLEEFAKPDAQES